MHISYNWYMLGAPMYFCLEFWDEWFWDCTLISDDDCFENAFTLDQRDGSAVKSTVCSSRDHEFNSQPPHWDSQTTTMESEPSSGMQVYMQIRSVNLKKKCKKKMPFQSKTDDTQTFMFIKIQQCYNHHDIKPTLDIEYTPKGQVIIT